MAVPTPNDLCWQRLAGGALSRIRTRHLGMQFLIKRIERSADPAAAKASEIHAFFAKWEPTLGDEIQQLSRL